MITVLIFLAGIFIGWLVGWFTCLILCIAKEE